MDDTIWGVWTNASLFGPRKWHLRCTSTDRRPLRRSIELISLGLISAVKRWYLIVARRNWTLPASYIVTQPHVEDVRIATVNVSPNSIRYRHWLSHSVDRIEMTWANNRMEELYCIHRGAQVALIGQYTRLQTTTEVLRCRGASKWRTFENFGTSWMRTELKCELICYNHNAIDPFIFVSQLHSYMKTLRTLQTWPTHNPKNLAPCTCFSPWQFC